MADGSGPMVMARAGSPGAGLPNTVVGFAGGGGLCDAFKHVTGLDPSLAMNHWDVAVYVHQKLFPKTEHYRGDIFDMDPLSWRPGEAIRFGWFSPDCTDHSKAKGGVPKTERIRGLAWSVIPWAKLRRLQTIMLENVEEWWDWGPIHRSANDNRGFGETGEPGTPIKGLRGSTRALWVRRMNQAGYWVERRELVTADYGVPTTRKRLYLIAEYVGVERVTKIALGLEPSPIVWAPPTHAARKKAAKVGRKPWIGFDTCADWSEPCPSIFLTPDEVKDLRATTGRSVKRPLAWATLKRVARGLDRYVISSGAPFIVPITQRTWGGDRAHGVRDPLKTVTAAKGGEYAMVAPTLVPTTHGGDARAYDPLDPLRTVTSVPGGEFAVIAPVMVPRYGEREGQLPRALDITEPSPTVVPTGNGSSLVVGSLVRTNFHSGANTNGVREVHEPVATVTGDGGFGLTVAHHHQMNTRDVGAAADDPLRTVTGGDHQAVVSATIVGCGGRRGQSPPLDIEGPMATMTGKADACLVAATLTRQFGTSTAADIEEPVGTIMAGGGGKTQMVAAHLGSYYGTQNGFIPDEPMNTATGHARHAMTMAWLEQANTGMVGHEMGEPISTIVGKRCTQRLVEARLSLDGGAIGRRADVLEFLWSHFGLPTPAEWADPAGTLDARRKFGIVLLPCRSGVTPGGVPDPLATEPWLIVDIGLRMLLAKELARATGLSDDHDMSTDCFGRAVSKTHQTMMIGNMVPREPAASLIRTQCPDMIPSEEREAA